MAEAVCARAEVRLDSGGGLHVTEVSTSCVLDAVAEPSHARTISICVHNLSAFNRQLLSDRTAVAVRLSGAAGHGAERAILLCGAARRATNSNNYDPVPQGARAACAVWLWHRRVGRTYCRYDSF